MQITWEDLKAAEEAVGEFGGDNRAGVQGTLHRISALRNRKGTVVGLTCRVGRAVTGHMDMIRDMIEGEPPHLQHVNKPACHWTCVLTTCTCKSAKPLKTSSKAHLDDNAYFAPQCQTRSYSLGDRVSGRPQSSGAA